MGIRILEAFVRTALAAGITWIAYLVGWLIGADFTSNSAAGLFLIMVTFSTFDSLILRNSRHD